jgi:hypothetical protein
MLGIKLSHTRGALRVDTAVTVSPERFAEGMTIQQFVQGMSKNQETFIQNYNGFTLKPEDEAFLKAWGKPMKVLVLAEDWCGDVLRYLPVFARMVEIAPQWDARVFYRDANPDLSDLWLKEGKYRSIPVMVFFDEDMNEIACYVERPAAVYQSEALAKEAFISLHSQLEDASLPVTEMSPETYNTYVTYIREFRSKQQPEWQQLFVDEIKAKLQNAASA